MPRPCVTLRFSSAFRVLRGSHRDFEVTCLPVHGEPVPTLRDKVMEQPPLHGPLWLGFAAKCHGVTHVAISGKSPEISTGEASFFLVFCRF